MKPPIRVETIKQVVEMATSEYCVSFTYYNHASVTRGRKKIDYTHHYTVFCDYGTTERICVYVNVYANSTYIEVKHLDGYNFEKHCWESELRSYRTVDDSSSHKQRLRSLTNFRTKLWDETYSYQSRGNQNSFSANRRDNRLMVY